MTPAAYSVDGGPETLTAGFLRSQFLIDVSFHLGVGSPGRPISRVTDEGIPNTHFLYPEGMLYPPAMAPLQLDTVLMSPRGPGVLCASWVGPRVGSRRRESVLLLAEQTLQHVLARAVFLRMGSGSLMGWERSQGRLGAWDAQHPAPSTRHHFKSNSRKNVPWVGHSPRLWPVSNNLCWWGGHSSKPQGL